MRIFSHMLHPAEDQIIVAVPSKVAWNYLSGWFTVILSTLPLDTIIGGIMMSIRQKSNPLRAIYRN